MKDMIGDMTDEWVMHWFGIVGEDLAKACEEEPNSEWHSACFAASVLLAQEMNKRGLTKKPAAATCAC